MREAVASKRLGVSLMGLGLLAGALGGGLAFADSKDSKPDQDSPKADPVAVGSEIFHREWMPNDPRGQGDGLGPVFNDSSCIACHNSGGSGGAGPVSKNIDILSASRNPGFMVQPVQQAAPSGAVCAPPDQSALEPLFALHAGFRTGGKTVVLHKFGTDPAYDSFRTKLLAGSNQAQGGVINFTGSMQLAGELVEMTRVVNTINNNTVVASGPGIAFVNSVDGRVVDQKAAKPDPRLNAALARMNEVKAAVQANRAGMTGTINVGPFVVSRSQRNPTPLFGLGLIDSIPESAIVAMAQKQAKETPEVAGRPAKVADGRIGRLGWKGQTANSEDFVLNACAVEVGLEVPGHSQAMTPQAPRYKGPGLDLSKGECDSLVAYVRSIPRPVERATTSAAEAKFLGAGKEVFSKIGCASCHSAKLGDVEGLYSDLLIHDMGDEIADSGSYDGSDSTDEPLVPLITAQNGEPQQQAQPVEPKSARKKEWRTPPLWGFRDSAPYLHDGRAQTLEQAVAFHGGQGTASAQKFFLLSPTERLQLEGFLKSLVAPSPVSSQRDYARAGE
jgi:CxxC motif-containing protein (DUF1111 family)